jgi:predicted ATP-binding protein involved in virulence
MAVQHKRATYFTDLHIKNARSFKGEHHLCLTDKSGAPARWTMILGENGVGKTTLLQCLAYLKPSFNTRIRDDGSEQPVDFLEAAGVDEVESIIELGRQGDIAFEIKASFLSNSSLGVRPNKSTGKFEVGISFDRVDGIVERFDGINHDSADPPEPLILCYGPSRHMGVGNADAMPPSVVTSSLFDDTVQLIDAEELIQQLDYIRLKRRTHVAKRQLDMLLEMIAALLPDVQSKEDINVQPPSPIQKGAKTGVHVKTPYGEIPLRQLSFGYQTMTAWLADMAWQLFMHFPHSDNPLREPAIVLVDEIDIHLHPRWQRELRELLTNHFPAVQFIATAHSPLMAQANMDENLIVVVRDDDGAAIRNDPMVVSTWRVDQVITSELFGLESPWPPNVDQLLEEQRSLTAKRTLTKKQKARLGEIQAKVLALPTEESPEDKRAMDIIRRAAEALTKVSA